MPTVVSVFDFPGDVAAAVTQLRSRGFEDLTTYSPAPFTEIEKAEEQIRRVHRIMRHRPAADMIQVLTRGGESVWPS